MIAITINRKVTYVKTNYKVRPVDWDNERKKLRSSFQNHLIHNAAIDKQISDLQTSIASRQIDGRIVTGKMLKASKSDSSFEKFAKEVRWDEKEVNRLKSFAPGLTLQDIDVTFLRKYEAHEKRRGMSQNTRNTTFKYIRRILNQAEKEGIIKDNPFHHFDIPRYRQSDRVYLINSEIEKLLPIQLPELYNTVRWYLLLGCYSGLRHSDWERFDPEKMVEDGFLKLRAKKNKKSVVLPIGKTLQLVIDKIKLLPRVPTLQTCNDYLKSVAMMAGINKKISTHTGRHTFGYICAKNKIPKSVTAELMGVSVQTVEVYYHLAGEDIIEQASILKDL